ncbi:DUF3558 domain-containing protein [Nocardia terpenica]|uniref:DUF3558 domain-containing protein n=1 Tax=Nocardia terpenica TaxID=455432 RepID=UPI0012FDB78A|nr:DUF3558 domain-containing protein [Nocardia terpenica]
MIATVSACGSSNKPAPAPESPTSATPSARPTLTASNIQPPSQDNRFTKTSNRPKVVYDPCTWIPDDVVSKLGYDPSTRHRLSDFVAEYTFLTCQFRNSDGALNLNSGNITLEEDKQQYAGKTQDTTVNGREAIIVKKTSADDCTLDMRTKAGLLGITVIIDTPGQTKGLKPCDHISEIASAIEPTIGKDN